MRHAVTADTSVVIAALSPWAERHQVARSALDPVQALPAHVQLEAVSVLTRLPHGLAVPPATAVAAVRGLVTSAPLVLSVAEHDALVTRLADARIRGGAVYDALVAATAVAAGATLLSLDERARATYAAVGARISTPA